MWLPTATVRRALAGMRATDLASPAAAFVLQLAIELLAADQPPEPVALYTHAITTGRATGEHQRGRLGKWLIDSYHVAAHLPPLIADHLKAVLLETAWRRALRDHAVRLLQAVDECSTDNVRDLADDTTTVDELWARYRAAATAAGLEPEPAAPTGTGTADGSGVAA